MAEKKRIVVPFDTPAGRRCYEVIFNVAMNLLADGKKAISDFVLANFPNAEEKEIEYNDGILKRTIKFEDGTQAIVVYDYTTKCTSAEQTPVPEVVKKESALYNYRPVTLGVG